MPIPDRTDPSFGNQILAALPEQVYQELLSHLKLAHCEYGQVLYEPGQKMRFVYFPCNSVISLVHITEDGASVEVGLVGKEGMVGIPVALGATASPYRAVVQVANSAVRMRADDLRNEFNKGGRFNTCSTLMS
jgi:hypothetical protein